VSEFTDVEVIAVLLVGTFVIESGVAVRNTTGAEGDDPDNLSGEYGVIVN
jgi:hypothetical protein